jgi:hypothetical protein
MNMKRANDGLALLGAAVGGVLGYLGFFWVAKQGFYVLILPGALVGIGAGLFKNRSIAVSVVCGLLALILGLLTEWRFAPFAQDSGLGFFLGHVHQLKPLTLVMISAGGLIGFWVPFQSRKKGAGQA